MKATIKEVGGRVVELEGTASEIREAMGWLTPFNLPYRPIQEPVIIPTVWPLEPWPYSPPTITWEVTDVSDGQAPTTTYVSNVDAAIEAAMEAAFHSTPEELGKAAVSQAKKDSCNTFFKKCF